jgi:hypothetical protein
VGFISPLKGLAEAGACLSKKAPNRGITTHSCCCISIVIHFSSSAIPVIVQN